MGRVETRAIVEAAKSGELPLDEIRRLPDDEQRRCLTELLKSGVLSTAKLDRLAKEEWALQIAAERDALYPDLAARLAKEGWAKAKKPLYFRLGELPEGGRSTTEVEGIWERGISAFGGRLTRGGHFIVSATSWGQAMEFVRLCQEEDRSGYLL